MPDRAAESCPLTAPQAGIWFAQQRDTTNPVFTTGQYVRLPAGTAPERFARAVEQALGEVWGLAVTVTAEGEVPVQRRTGVAPRVEVVDLATQPDPETVALNRMRADLARPTNAELVREVLFTWPGGAVWFHRCHHVLLDGYGFSLVLRRIEEIYEALRTDTTPGEHRFGELGAYLDEQDRYLDSERPAADRAYWLEALAGIPAPVSLSGTRPEPARGAPLKATVDELPSLTSLAEQLQATTADLVIAGAAAYQHRLTGVTDVVLALPLALRTGTAARLPSTTVNVLPLRLRVAAGDSVGELVARLREAMRDLRRHGRYRIEDIRRDLGLVTAESELTTTQVNIKSYRTVLRLPGGTSPVVDLSPGPVDDIAFVAGLAEDGALTGLEVEANALRYDEPTARAHGRGFARLLATLASAEPTTTVGELDPVGPVYDDLATGLRERDLAARAAVLRPPAEPLRLGGNTTDEYQEQSVPVRFPAALDQAAERLGAERDDVALAAFAALLLWYTGQEDLTLGVSSVDGKILPIRLRPEARLSFTDLVAATAADTAHAREHSRAPLDELARRVGEDTALFERDLRLEQDRLVYNGLRFTEERMATMATHFETILTQLAERPEQPVSAPDPLTEAERHTQLVTWNPGDASYAETPVHELIRRARPDAIAVTDGETALTYAELLADAETIARGLLAHGVRRGELVALLVDRGADQVRAMLGTLLAGAAYLPIDPAIPVARKEFILADSQVRIAVSDGAERFDGQLLALRDLLAQPTTDVVLPEVPLDSPAYCIYTSGTTGTPKGVVLTHRNLARLVDNDAFPFDFGPADVWTMFHSYAFDFSVWELFCGLVHGGRVVMVSPEQTRDPQLFLDLLRRERVTVLNQTPSAFTRLVRIGAELPDLRYVIFGGEALQPRLLAGFAEAHPRVRLVNMYGITETTVHASIHPVTAEDLSSGASVIGGPIPTTKLFLLDRHTGRRLLPVGAVGEIHVGGAGVAGGYLGRPELTAERFVPSPFGDGTLFRSGDLAAYTEDGSLRYLGRADAQIQLRGYRVEPGEVQACLAEHPAVAESVVFAEDQQLVAVVQSRQQVSADELRALLAAKLPAYLVPSLFHVVPQIPLTVNGKVDLAALRAEAARRTSAAAVREPGNPRERALTEILAKVLGAERLGPDDDFFAAGGHSLTAARAATEIRAQFGVEIGVADVFDTRTAAGLATRLDTAPPTRAPLRPVARPARPPLSPAQRGLWFLNQLDGGATYHIPLVLPLTKQVDVDALRAALGDVAARHESLRTVFPADSGVPYQEIREPGPVALPVVDCPAEEISAHVAAASRQHLDLTREPGFRAGLYGPAGGARTLVLLLHHLVADGWSLRPLAQDLTTAYAARAAGRAPELPPLPVQYADFVLWQQDRLDPAGGGAAARDEEFWRATLAGLPDEPALPVDRPRPVRPTGRGGAVDLTVDAAAHEALRQLARAHDVSLFTVLHAGLAALLTGLGAGEDLAIGTPVAGRHDRALDEVVGLVTNTVVLRTDTSGCPAVAELLARLQAGDRAAWAHEDLPFEQVVELLNPPRVPGRHPLFTVMLALQNNAAATVSLGGPPVPLRPSATGTAKFDLFFDVTEHTDEADEPAGLTCHVEFARDLFDPGTARLLAEGLVTVLARAAAEPGAGIDSLVPEGLLAARTPEPEAPDTDLEARLRALSAVADVAVTDVGVWVVPARPGADDDVRRLLGDQTRVTAVTALPRTEDGHLDVAALNRLPIVDEVAADAWRTALAAVPGVRAATVTRDEIPEDLEALPLATRVRAAVEESPAAPSVTSDKLSLSEGPELPAAEVDGWGDALRRAATRGEHAEIVHVRADGSETRRTYASVIEEANHVLGGLRALGLRPGDKIVLQCEDTEDFVAALWGAIAAGVTVVPLTVPGTYATDSAASNKLDGIWRMLGRPIIVTSAAKAEGLRAFGERRDWPDPRIATVDDLRTGDPAEDWHRADPDELLLMLLTSGSTGLPKAVRLTHGNVLSRAVAATVTNSLTEHDVSLNWIPLDHVTGVVMFHLRDVYLGARQVHAPTGWILEDPLRWWELADRWRASVTWAPNFAFGLVVEQADRLAGRGWDLSPVHLIMNAGEVVVGATNRRFLRALAPFGLRPDVLHPGWGMSETCSVVTDTVLAAEAPPGGDETFVSCGRPYPGFAMRVVDDELRLRPEGEVGRLQVRGTSVTSGYHDNPGANADSFTADGWFDTGDLAFLREGELYITGRVKDVIIVNGVNHFSHEIEACVEELPVVVRSFTAAVAVRADAAAGTDQLALFVHLAPGHDTGEAAAAALRAIRGKVAREAGVAPAFVLPVEAAAIPKTEIGKIQRTQLRKRFEAGEFAQAVRDAEVLAGTAATVPHWFLRPQWTPVRRPRTSVGASVLIVTAGARGTRLAELISARVRADGGLATTVSAGPAYSRTDAARYTARVADSGDLGALVDRLAADGRGPERIVHLGPWDACGEASVLALFRVLARSDYEVDLRVVTDGSPEHALLTGLLPSLRDERPGLTAGTIAVPGGVDAAELIAEELAVAPADAEVRRQGGERLVRRLVPVPVPSSVTAPSYRDGFVLVTGGLGGVGARVAEHLLTAEPGVRLLLIGRTADADIETLRKLGEVRYAAADVTDPTAVESAVEAASEAWSASLTGILHLAGTIDRRPATDLDPVTWRAAIAAKVDGATVLDGLTRRHPVRSFVSFSSVNGTFGAAFSAPYAAACAFLDALAVEQRARGLDAQSLAWSTWRDTGMSEGDELAALGETRGYRALDVETALRSFDLARGLAEPAVLIGADRRADGIRRLVDGPARARYRLAARVELDDGADLGVLHETAVAAATHASGGIAEHGAVLRAAGTSTSESTSDADTGDRVNALEEAVLTVWRKVLGRDKAGAADNFFDLGGHSLMLVRAQAELNEALGSALTVVDLFAHPSARALAAHLVTRSDFAAPDSDRGTAKPGGPLGRAREQALRRREARSHRNRKGKTSHAE
ncbi:amino acid adenylation domain-containing protein [Amycolatopsis sp. NPDC001319]|uniref:amino acid adenylation domain-containing protein n=1 Tax=unclassified Amycolatopsis TaxID=2618356 RepID=UPI0036BCA209